MKEALYANGRSPHDSRGGRVRYVIDDNQCIFSGMSRPGEFMSTINAAEYVVEAIAEAEKIDPRRLIFFDLRTHHSYPDLSEGRHEMLRLNVTYDGTTPVGVRWDAATCPRATLDLFGVFFN